MSRFSIQQGLFNYDVVDHFAILGCSLDATPKQIRQNYLKIAYLLHPDTCKAEADADKQTAAKLFSKLVNPAYEALSREATRTESILIATQTARNLTEAQLIFKSSSSQELLAATIGPELVYHKVVTPLAQNLYDDFQAVLNKIGQLSEFNLIYLHLKDASPTKSGPPARSAATNTSSSEPSTTPKSSPQSTTVPGKSSDSPSPPPDQRSRLEKVLDRAQELYDNRQYDKAISELRTALKQEPKNGHAHSLLGLSYLQNNMLTMAKVHIKTAGELAPTDPLVVLAKRELAKQTNIDTKSRQKDSQGGFLGTLFGNKKKS